MPQYANADRIVVHGFWKDELGGTGVPGATVTFDPVPLTSGTTGTPNLRDLTAYGHLKLRQMVATVDPTSGYYAAIVVSNNDPDLDAYLGRRVTFSGESPFTIAVPYNAPSVTVDAAMAAAIPELTVGSTVKAIWLVEASLVDGTPPPPLASYMTSTQTLSAIATAVGSVRQVPSGGNAGQVVTKTSDSYAWADPPAGGGGGGSYTAENARDDVGAALRVTGAGSLAVDDPGDTITINVDLPEATQSARTAAIGTPTDLLKVTSRYDTTAGAITQPLPAATAGRVLAIGLDAGTNALTLTANGSDVIGSGAATSLALALVGEVRTLHCTTAGRWRIVSGNTPTSALDARYAAAGSGGGSGPALNTLLRDWTYVQSFQLAALRTDTISTTSGSPTISDSSIVAGDLGRPVSGAGIPTGSYVGTVTAGTSFLLSSSPTSQVSVNATATATGVTATLLGAARDANGAIQRATIFWPDGSSGLFTTTTASTAFPGAIDAYNVTYVPASGSAVTVTQAAVTRDANGAVVAQPALTFA